MRLTQRVLLEREQLPKHVSGEMALGIRELVDDGGRQRLLGRLPLEDLLLDRALRDEPVHEAWVG